MAQRRDAERMDRKLAGITAAHRFRRGERPGRLAQGQVFSSVDRQVRNLELIKRRSDTRRHAAAEKENAPAPDPVEAPPPTPVAAPLMSPPPPPPLMAPQQWAPWAMPKSTHEPKAPDDQSAFAPLLADQCALQDEAPPALEAPPDADERSAFAAPSPLALELPSPAAKRRPRGSAATAVRAAHRRLESAQEAARARKAALLEAERTRVAAKVAARVARRTALKRGRDGLAMVAAARVAVLLTQGLRSARDRRVRVDAATTLVQWRRRTVVVRRIRALAAVGRCVRGSLRFAVTQRVRRRRIARRRLRFFLEAHAGARGTFRHAMREVARRVRVVQRATSDYRVCSTARLTALRLVWRRSVEADVDRERRVCDALDARERKARKAISADAAKARQVQDLRTKKRRAAAHDAERDRKFTTIKQSIGDMKTRLMKADALVEMGHAAPSKRKRRTTGTDAVVAAVKNAVSQKRRDAVLKRLLADARRAFAARSGGVALERAKASVHGVGEARGVLNGNDARIPRSKLVPVLPLFSQAWRSVVAPSPKKQWAAPSPLLSPGWTAVHGGNGPPTPSGKRVWKMVKGKQNRRRTAAATAASQASLTERVQALYRREVDRANRRKAAHRDARLVARRVLSPSKAAKPPPPTCRARKAVSFSRDVLFEEG